MSRPIIYLFLLPCLLFSSLLQAQENDKISALENIVKYDPDSLISLIQSKQIKTLNKAQELYLLSYAYEQLGNYNLADSLIHYAIDNLSFKNDSSLYIKYLMILVDQRKISNDYGSAFKYLYSIIDYSERNKDTVDLVSSHILMGELYRAIEKFDLSLKYLEKGEKIISQYSNDIPDKIYARLLNRRAATLMQAELYPDSVESLSLMAILLSRKIMDKDLEATSLNELGYLYLNKKPTNPKSEEYLLNAIKLWEQMGCFIYATNARMNLARYFNRTKRYDEGINCLLEVKERVDQSNWNWEKGGYYEMLGRLFSKQKKFEEAYHYSGLAKRILLNVAESQYNQRLTLLSTQLEIRKKEDELLKKQLEIDRAKHEYDSKIVENQVLSLSLIGVFTISIIILLVLIYSTKQRKKLKEQQEVNLETNKKLFEAVAQKETLLKEVNHRVKNNLSILSSLLYLQQKKLKSEEAQTALKDSQVRINTISLVHESLYNRDDMEEIDFQDYLKKLIHHIKGIYWSKEQEIDINIKCENFTPELSLSIPLAMIINELITNSFKYAFNDNKTPEICIEYKNNQLIYYDNGPGLPKKVKDKTLGLNLIQIFTKQINASHHIKELDSKYINIIDFNKNER